MAHKIVKTRQKAIPGCYSAKLNNFISKLLEKKPKNRPGITEVLNLFPKYVIENYTMPYISTEKPVIDIHACFNPKKEEPKELPKILGNIESKTNFTTVKRTASVNKYPERFKMYLISNNKLSTSRSLGIKPMPNISSHETREISLNRPSTAIFSDRKPTLPQRPSTAHATTSSFSKIIPAAKFKLVLDRPSSVIKKATVNDLLSLD